MQQNEPLYVIDGLNADDVVVPDADPDVVKALDNIRVSERLIADLKIKSARLEGELSEAKEALSTAAALSELGEGSDANFETATALVAKLESALNRAELAKPAANRRLAEA